MDRRIRLVLALLAEPLEVIRVHDLAARVGVGASRLGHLFKREVKMSIRAFVRERRLAKAVGLLASTNAPISAISFDAGFPDISNFNHPFKKRFGVSPTRYRERVATAEHQPAPLSSDVGRAMKSATSV